MIAFLVLLAFAGGIIGFFFLSQATMGVGIIALGCLAGILARIAQASQHQAEIKELMKALGGQMPKA